MSGKGYLSGMGFSLDEVLKKAALPEDLFARPAMCDCTCSIRRELMNFGGFPHEKTATAGDAPQIDERT